MVGKTYLEGSWLTGGTGIASSAANLPNIYTCVIERVSGLPAEYVRRVLSKFLNYEFHENPASFTYPDPAGGLDRNGAPRMQRCCPHIELRGRPSDAFVADINNGRLSGITLVKTEAVTPVGGAAYLTKQTSELKLGIDHQNLPANLWNDLVRTLNRVSQDFSKAKISYALPGGKRHVTLEIETATGTIANEAYIKYFELNNIFPFLAQSAQSIVPHLRDLVIPQLVANRSI